jgi:hypothetical protein
MTITIDKETGIANVGTTTWLEFDLAEYVTICKQGRTFETVHLSAQSAAQVLAVIGEWLSTFFDSTHYRKREWIITRALIIRADDDTLTVFRKERTTHGHKNRYVNREISVDARTAANIVTALTTWIANEHLNIRKPLVDRETNDYFLQ